MVNETDNGKNTRINDYITDLWYCYAGELKRFFISKAIPDEIEDLLQATFERFYASLLRNLPEQPEVVIRNARAYLYTIARNVWLDELYRKKYKISFISSDAIVGDDTDDDHSILEYVPDDDSTPEEAFLSRERILELRAQIKQLPSDERDVLYCTYFEGLTLKQTSDFLKLSMHTVNTLRLRARHHLRKGLLSKGDENTEPFPNKFTEPEQDSADNNSCPLDRDTLVPAVSELASQITQLREPYRSVLTLAMLERRKYTQIAALRGCSVGTIKGQISRGIRLLQSVQQPVQFSVSLPSQTSIVPRELPHLDALQEKYRSILTLREIQGYSYAQIAVHLQIPVSLVKKRLHCARVAYRALLDQHPRQSRMVPRRKRISLDELSRLNHPAYHHFYEALQLAYVDHLSDEEIAVRLHRPVNTIKAHIARGIKLLAPVEPPEEPERSLLNA